MGLFDFLKKKEPDPAEAAAAEDSFIDVYVDYMTVHGSLIAFAVFSLEEGRRLAPYFLEQVMREIGSMENRLEDADGDIPGDPQWRDFFAQWSKAMANGNLCVLLPRSVTFGENVYAKMVMTDVGFSGGAVELSKAKIPKNHIVPAIVQNAGELSNLTLKFLV